MQSRLHSFIESAVNIIIGYSINVFAQYLIFPIFDINISISTNLKIGLIFTVISLARSYLIRRYFTKKTENNILVEKYN